MHHSLLLRGTVVAIVMIALGASAQAPDPLVAAGTSDPLRLASIVDRIGDDAVLERLTGEEIAGDARLAAVRAAPRMQAPERALEPLAALAIGRDPDVAPAAALSMLEIARALDPRDLDAREVMREELAPARAAAARLAEDETARGDLRRAAGIVVELLGALGAAGAPPSE
jgi:hypothetical protein